MLECACVILHVIVIIVGIGEEILIAGVDECARQVGCRKTELLGIVHLIYLLWIIIQIFTYLITQVGVGVAVAHHLYRIVHTDSAVVGGDNHLESQLSHTPEDVE